MGDRCLRMLLRHISWPAPVMVDSLNRIFEVRLRRLRGFLEFLLKSNRSQTASLSSSSVHHASLLWIVIEYAGGRQQCCINVPEGNCEGVDDVISLNELFVFTICTSDEDVKILLWGNGLYSGELSSNSLGVATLNLSKLGTGRRQDGWVKLLNPKTNSCVGKLLLVTSVYESNHEIETEKSYRNQLPDTADKDYVIDYESEVFFSPTTDPAMFTSTVASSLTEMIACAPCPSLPSVIKNKDSGDIIHHKGSVEFSNCSTPTTSRKSDNISIKLELDFIHGVRSVECRDCLYVTKNNELVYFVNSIAVIYEEEHRIQRYYTCHTDDIQSMTMHPCKTIVATGQIGEGGRIHVWSTESLCTLSLLEMPGETGVVSLSFSPCGSKLLHIGTNKRLDSHLSVWDWSKGFTICQAIVSPSYVFSAKFNPYRLDEFVTVGVNGVSFWTLRGRALRRVEGDVAVSSGLNLSFNNHGQTVVGTFDGDLSLWDSGRMLRRHKSAHESSVLCVTAKQGRGGGLLSSGNGHLRGCKVIVWSFGLEKRAEFSIFSTARSMVWVKNNIIGVDKHSTIFRVNVDDVNLIDNQNTVCDVNPIRAIEGHSAMDMAELWGLDVHPSKPLFVTGGDDGCVCIWSAEKRCLLRRADVSGKVRAVTFSPDGRNVVAALLEGDVVSLDTESLTIRKQCTSRETPAVAISYAPDGQRIAVGYQDGFIEILTSVALEVRTSWNAHSSIISHIDWSTDGLNLRSCVEGELLYHNATRGVVTSSEDVLHKEWYTSSCVYQWGTKGLWDAISSSESSNLKSSPIAVDVFEGTLRGFNPDLGITTKRKMPLLASVDCTGYVHLHKYPASNLEELNEIGSYRAHTHKVSNCRFLNSEYLITIGSTDVSVCVWRFLFVNKEGDI